MRGERCGVATSSSSSLDRATRWKFALTRLATSGLVYRLMHSPLLQDLAGFSGWILTFLLRPPLAAVVPNADGGRFAPTGHQLFEGPPSLFHLTSLLDRRMRKSPDPAREYIGYAGGHLPAGRSGREPAHQAGIEDQFGRTA